VCAFVEKANAEREKSGGWESESPKGGSRGREKHNTKERECLCFGERQREKAKKRSKHLFISI